MYYVYLLRSGRINKIYTGYTNDLRKRIIDHKSKQVHTTARMGDVKLIFYEAFTDERDARRREKYLKTTKGKRAIKLMLKNSLAPRSSSGPGRHVLNV